MKTEMHAHFFIHVARHRHYRRVCADEDGGGRVRICLCMCVKARTARNDDEMDHTHAIGKGILIWRHRANAHVTSMFSVVIERRYKIFIFISPAQQRPRA